MHCLILCVTIRRMKEIPLWLKHPGIAIGAILWDNAPFKKFLNQRGQIKVIIYPNPDGEFDKNGQWVPSVDVEIEDSWFFNMYKNQYRDRIVEIPATCFKLGKDSSGPILQIDMTKVQPYFTDKDNSRVGVMLLAQEG